MYPIGPSKRRLLSERPRIADFAKWATAAEPAFGWADGGFMQAYARNRQTVQNAAIDGNPLAEAILQLTALGAWEGTATELLTTLHQC
jgi:putative DNA primase/helicase